MGQKLRGRSKPTVECPRCGRSIAVTIAKRWHFDNCRGVTVPLTPPACRSERGGIVR